MPKYCTKFYLFPLPLIFKNKETIMNDEDIVFPEDKKGVSASSDYTKL